MNKYNCGSMFNVAELARIVREKHGAAPFHIASVPVALREGNEEAWRVTVEIFELAGHPSATRVYVWRRDPKDDPTNPNRIVTVLHDGPAVWCADAAVRIARNAE